MAPAQGAYGAAFKLVVATNLDLQAAHADLLVTYDAAKKSAPSAPSAPAVAPLVQTVTGYESWLQPVKPPAAAEWVPDAVQQAPAVNYYSILIELVDTTFLDNPLGHFMVALTDADVKSNRALFRFTEKATLVVRNASAAGGGIAHLVGPYMYYATGVELKVAGVTVATPQITLSGWGKSLDSVGALEQSLSFRLPPGVAGQTIVAYPLFSTKMVPSTKPVSITYTV